MAGTNPVFCPPAQAASADSATGELRGVVHSSMSELPRDAFSRLDGGSKTLWDYCCATERMSSRHFTYGAVAVYDGRELVAAAPMFRVDYRLDEPLGPHLRAIGEWLHHRAPSWITMPVIGLGSPVLDECPIAISPIVDGARRREGFAALIDTLEQHAAGEGVRVVALKDVTAADRVWCDPVLGAHRYSAIPAPPIAKLELPFACLDDYLASLSPKMRQDLRRKMRQAAGVRIEYRDTIDGLEQQIEALYRATRDHRKASFDVFDELPGGYFREIMAGLHGAARLQLMWIGTQLGGFNLFIDEPHRISGKFLGLDYRLARTHNLYFVNWTEMVGYAIARGRPQLHVGVSSYGLKARLGCRLHRSWVYCRHTGAVRGPLFRLLTPYAAFDRMDPELCALGDAAPYAEPAPLQTTG